MERYQEAADMKRWGQRMGLVDSVFLG